jgi:hypothetical protein
MIDMIFLPEAFFEALFDRPSGGDCNQTCKLGKRNRHGFVSGPQT